MKLARNAAEVLAEHTTLELECIDRMYLNVYVPMLQTGAGTSYFFRKVRGNPVPSSALMEPMTRRFVAAIRGFVRDNSVDLVRFERRERKDDRTREYLRRSDGAEGVLYVGVAQEKARVLRTERREDPVFGPYPWLVSSTAMVNHYYVYIVDEDFGPLFVKFCAYFPYNAKLCINGHEYLKRQLAKRRLRGAGQRRPELRGPGADAAPGRGPDGGEDRRAAAQMAFAAAASVHERRPAGRHPLRRLRPAYRSSPSPRCSTGPSRGGSSSRRSCARTSTWAVPTTCS